MRIVLKSDTEVLEEVVVTAYGTSTKGSFTGSAAVMKADKIEKRQVANVSNALAGAVAGVQILSDNGQPGVSAKVRIRGVGSISASKSPLYVIDGVVTKADDDMNYYGKTQSVLSTLNPEDIESMTVLKDAAAASLYGSRAANGVIIITTKKGKEGQLKINFDASVSASMYTNKLEVLNAEEYGRAMWQAYVNEGQDPNTNNLGYLYDWNYGTNGYPQLNGISMRKYLDAAGTVPAADTDWFDRTTRTGIIQQYNVSVSNGSEKGSSFFSLGYYKNLGVIKDTDFDRFSARMNSDYKLIDDILTIGQHFTLNRTSEVQAPGGIIETALDIPSAIPVYASDGSWGRTGRRMARPS